MSTQEPAVYKNGDDLANIEAIKEEMFKLAHITAGASSVLVGNFNKGEAAARAAEAYVNLTRLQMDLKNKGGGEPHR